MTTMTETPKAWIGELASYNAGRLIGEWVDAIDADEMYEARKRVAVTAVAAAKEAGEYPVYFGEPEEFFIADYDGFGDLTHKLGEYASFELVAKIGALIEEHGDEFIAYVTAVEPDLDEVDEYTFQEARRGEWGTREDYARDWTENCGYEGVSPGTYVLKDDWSGRSEINVLEVLMDHLDFEMISRDLEASGSVDFAEVNGKIYAFNPNAR